jgi:uncharacterized protein
MPRTEGPWKTAPLAGEVEVAMLIDLADTAVRDLKCLLALNNAHAIETSELDASQLVRMLDGAFLALTDVDARALLIAFDQHGDYNSPNFLWFKARYVSFVYVDRVIVAAALRGQGVARRLYDRLFDAARAAGHRVVVCEVNSQPPNPGSDAFHAALGFAVVGEAVLANGKCVRYLARAL